MRRRWSRRTGGSLRCCRLDGHEAVKAQGSGDGGQGPGQGQSWCRSATLLRVTVPAHPTSGSARAALWSVDCRCGAGPRFSFMAAVHRREDILGIAPELGADDVAYLAPQAAGNTLEISLPIPSPIPQNEPGLDVGARGVSPGSSRSSRPKVCRAGSARLVGRGKAAGAEGAGRRRPGGPPRSRSTCRRPRESGAVMSEPLDPAGWRRTSSASRCGRGRARGTGSARRTSGPSTAAWGTGRRCSPSRRCACPAP